MKLHVTKQWAELLSNSISDSLIWTNHCWVAVDSKNLLTGLNESVIDCSSTHYVAHGTSALSFGKVKFKGTMAGPHLGFEPEISKLQNLVPLSILPHPGLCLSHSLGLTEIQGCLRASEAVMRLAGLIVSILLMRSFASGVTVSHSGEGNFKRERERNIFHLRIALLNQRFNVWCKWDAVLNCWQHKLLRCKCEQSYPEWDESGWNGQRKRHWRNG